MAIFGAGRFQFSVRSLLLMTAVLALSLAPVVWVTRERQQMLRAREEAIRSVLLAERRRVELRKAGARSEAGNRRRAPAQNGATEVPPVPPEVLIEHLRRENDELKDTVDSLRDEVKAYARRTR